MSDAVYLLQAPVYIALEPIAQRFGAGGLTGSGLGIYRGILLFSAGLAYQLFERPMTNWLRALQKSYQILTALFPRNGKIEFLLTEQNPDFLNLQTLIVLFV